MHKDPQPSAKINKPGQRRKLLLQFDPAVSSFNIPARTVQRLKELCNIPDNQPFDQLRTQILQAVDDHGDMIAGTSELYFAARIHFGRPKQELILLCAMSQSGMADKPQVIFIREVLTPERFEQLRSRASGRDVVGSHMPESDQCPCGAMLLRDFPICGECWTAATGRLKRAYNDAKRRNDVNAIEKATEDLLSFAEGYKAALAQFTVEVPAAYNIALTQEQQSHVQTLMRRRAHLRARELNVEAEIGYIDRKEADAIDWALWAIDVYVQRRNKTLGVDEPVESRGETFVDPTSIKEARKRILKLEHEAAAAHTQAKTSRKRGAIRDQISRVRRQQARLAVWIAENPNGSTATPSTPESRERRITGRAFHLLCQAIVDGEDVLSLWDGDSNPTSIARIFLDRAAKEKGLAVGNESCADQADQELQGE
jgi:hypothetical protein